MNKPREEEKEIKKIISDNVHNYKINCDTKEVISQIKEQIIKAIKRDN